MLIELTVPLPSRRVTVKVRSPMTASVFGCRVPWAARKEMKRLVAKFLCERMISHSM